MDGSGSLVGGDVVGEYAQDAAIEEWVLEGTRSSWLPLKRAISMAASSLQASRTASASDFSDDVDCCPLVPWPRSRSQDGRLRPAMREASMAWWSR